MCRKLISSVIIISLPALINSASAYVVPPGETHNWSVRTRIPDGYMEVYGTAHFYARVDFDAGDTLVVYDGGEVYMHDTCKFPDSSGTQNVLAYIYGGGLWDAHDIENRAYDRGDHIGLFDCGTLIVHTGYNTGDREYDPLEWVQDNTLRCEEYGGELEFSDLGGGAVEIHCVVPPMVEFDSADSNGPEGESPITLTVKLSEPVEEMVTVDYEVTGGTAEGSGVDYNIAPGPLTFDPYDTTETITIVIVNDANDEEDETIEVTLTSVSGGDVILGGITQHTYTIIDSRPGVKFDTATSIGMEDTTPANIAVVLSHDCNETVTVNYAVTGGTATGGGVDYNLPAGKLTFDPCQTTKYINIDIVNDVNTEGPETIELTLSQPNNAKLGDTFQHTFTIDDDELPSTYTNLLGMEFVLIMPGTFQMGSNDGEWDERPVHKVTISQPFYIQVEEVNAAQYKQFDPSYIGSGEATGISWHDANAFAAWLSQEDGNSCHLPTEAEWEYVCRAGTTTPYSSGGSPPSEGTPNPWGVKDMHNMPAEWVWNWHGEYPYENLVDPVGPEQGFARVVRGGYLQEDDDRDHPEEYFLRSSNRAGIAPGFAGGDHDVGFRLVLGEMPPTAPERYEGPFVRQCVKEPNSYVLQGPNMAEPYFNQRPLLPIPPDDASRQVIDAAGLHPSFRGHNHSPGMEVCPNGDVLMIIYTSYSEYEEGVSLMATRLRFGSNQWDMPTPMFDFPGTNDHAPMLWNDANTLHFFWGCPHLPGAGRYPFQWTSSTDSGATWDEVKFPEFVGSIGGHSRQPINTALRDDNTIYVSSDGSGSQSVLWKSDNNGQTWYDPGGRTFGRHTTFVFLNNGDILGMGGKNTDYNGTKYMPKSISDNGAVSWTESGTPFSYLNGNQRPCIVRLASGNLFFCSDFQHRGDCDQPAGITEYGALVALSLDDGQTWPYIKKIPTALPHECLCWDCGNVGTLGYSVARQSANGVIHVITTMNHPCQHFEFNEKWIRDANVGADLPPDPGESGTVNQYQENYPGGATKVTWSAKTCDDGRYLLHGTETWYYEGSQKQYEVTYYNGHRVGAETYWDPDGVKQWGWDHNEPDDTSVWTRYWPNTLKRVQSSWQYGGMVADGNSYHWTLCGQPVAAYSFVDGAYAGATTLPEPQTSISADITGDCSVDFNDLRELSDDWLAGELIYPVEPNDANLVLHYDFNETSGTTVADSTSNGYTGTFFVDVDQTPAEISGRMDPGRSGNSFHFWPGLATGGISMPNDVFVDNNITQEITVAVWIKNAHLGETPDSGAFMWEFREWDGVSTSGGNRVLAVETTGGNGNFTFYDDAQSVGVSVDWGNHTDWTHYGFVRDSAKLKVYVGGKLKSEVNSSGNPMAVPGLLYIGVSADRAPGNGSGLHDGFTGNMDDWKIYSYALSQEEVVGVMEMGPVNIGEESPANLDGSGLVNFIDYAILASEWLESWP